MEIRRLTPVDVRAYRALRLDGLRQAPAAFAASYEEEAAFPLSTYEGWLGAPPDRGTLGAFEGEALVGIVTLGRESRRKLAHKAHILGMYVRADRRGCGIAAALLARAIELARSTAAIRQINVTSNATNAAARRLYAAAGFREFGLEPRSLQIDGTWYDEVHMRLDFDL
jgi:RimJ/RimL family protein N-acetyltransferase